MIAVVDYKMGNPGSIINMLKRVGGEAELTDDPEMIARADRLILPGVGAFDAGMANLAQHGLLPALNRFALEERRPVLGICLGMQLMGRRSQEGSLRGLGWLDADTVRFGFDQAATGLKIPHMGWNSVRAVGEGGLFRGLEEEAFFYFVHSYHLVCDREEEVSGWTSHGYPFPAAVRRENVMGVQFHPEKSHRYGLTLLANFAEAGAC